MPLVFRAWMALDNARTPQRANGELITIVVPIACFVLDGSLFSVLPVFANTAEDFIFCESTVAKMIDEGFFVVGEIERCESCGGFHNEILSGLSSVIHIGCLGKSTEGFLLPGWPTTPNLIQNFEELLI